VVCQLIVDLEQVLIRWEYSLKVVGEAY